MWAFSLNTAFVCKEGMRGGNLRGGGVSQLKHCVYYQGGSEAGTFKVGFLGEYGTFHEGRRGGNRRCGVSHPIWHFLIRWRGGAETFEVAGFVGEY